MALHDEEFELGVVTVEVSTRDGHCNIEDWNPKDADEALEYAQETADCSDVTKTVFTDNQSDRVETFAGRAAAPQST